MSPLPAKPLAHLEPPPCKSVSAQACSWMPRAQDMRAALHQPHPALPGAAPLPTPTRGQTGLQAPQQRHLRVNTLLSALRNGGKSHFLFSLPVCCNYKHMSFRTGKSSVRLG